MIAEENVPAVNYMYSMRCDVRGPRILILRRSQDASSRIFTLLGLCSTSSLGIFTNDPRAGKLLPSGGGREQALAGDPLTALLTYITAGCRKASLMVSGEGYILVTFPPTPYCNPGPYSGHDVKIIYQSYRQDLERFALLTIPCRSLIITMYMYTWIHLNNTWPTAWAVGSSTPF